MLLLCTVNACSLLMQCKSITYFYAWSTLLTQENYVLWGKCIILMLCLSAFTYFRLGIYRRKEQSMEEQQIKSFVHTVLQDEKLRKELVNDPDAVIMREGFSPRVSNVIRKLVPYLAIDKNPSDLVVLGYWH
jgi:hypothetical protein